MRPIVGAVEDNRILGDAEFVDIVEKLADRFVMIDHGVVIFRLPSARLAQARRLGMVRKCMCVVLTQTKNGYAVLVRHLMKSSAPSPRISSSYVSMRLLCQRPGVFDLLRPSGFAQQCSTPRGPKFFRKLGNSSGLG